MFFNSKNKGTSFNLSYPLFEESKYTFEKNELYRTSLRKSIPIFRCSIDNNVKGESGPAGEDGAAGSDGKDGVDGANAAAPMGIVGPSYKKTLSFNWKPQRTLSAKKLSDFGECSGKMEYYILNSPSSSYEPIPLFKTNAATDTIQPFAFDFSFVFNGEYKDHACQVVAKHGNALYIGHDVVMLFRQHGASIPVPGAINGGAVYIVLGSSALLHLGSVTKNSPKKGIAVLGYYDERKHIYLTQTLHRFAYNQNSGLWQKDTTATVTGGSDRLCHSYYVEEELRTYTTNNTGKVILGGDGTVQDLVDTISYSADTHTFTTVSSGYYISDGTTTAESIGNYIIGSGSRFSILDTATG